MSETTEYFRRDGTPAGGKVKVIDAERATTTQTKYCGRCGGAGGSESWRHTGWTCYGCGGARIVGTEVVKLYSREKLAKLDATKAKRDAKRAAKRESAAAAKLAEDHAAFALWLETDLGQKVAEAVEGLKAIKADIGDGLNGESFLQTADSILRDRFAENRPLTEAQAGLVVKAVESFQRNQAEKAESRYLGEIGEAVTIEGRSRLVWDDPFGAYGWRGLWVVNTAHGEAKYSGSSRLPRDGRVRFVATVDKLDTNRGAKQTIVKRPRKIVWLDDEAESEAA